MNRCYWASGAVRFLSRRLALSAMNPDPRLWQRSASFSRSAARVGISDDLPSCNALAMARPGCIGCTKQSRERMRIRPPRRAGAALTAAWGASLHHWTPEPQTHRRKVWMMIPFGSDLQMLALHLETLASAVDGFLITESNTSFTRSTGKPLVATEALRPGGRLYAMRSMVHIGIVNLNEAATRGHCSHRQVGYARTSCVESWQRYQLLRLLAAHSDGNEDIAVLADHDEIAEPEALRLLRLCFPFDTSRSDSTFNMLVMDVEHFEFGMHCRKPLAWMHGPRAFPAKYLLEGFWRKGGQTQQDGLEPIPQSESNADHFSRLRSILDVTHPAMSGPAGYHLSSFGGGEAIRAKFSTWGHANKLLADDEQTLLREQTESREPQIAPPRLSGRRPHQPRAKCCSSTGFKGFSANGFEKLALDAGRLHRCASLCLSPYPQHRLYARNSIKAHVLTADMMQPMVVPPCLHGLPSAERSRILRRFGGAPQIRIAPTFASLTLGFGRVEDVSNGTDQVLGIPQVERPRRLPPSFLKPEFAALLFNFSFHQPLELHPPGGSKRTPANVERSEGSGFRGIWKG